MFNAIRSVATSRATSRAFSTSVSRADVAKLTLIGRLGRDPEVKQTKNNSEYVLYVVATKSFSPGPVDANGERPPPRTSWHRILSFQEGSNKYLQTLKKGSLVYVEAGYELREPEPEADPTTPEGQRQIFLRHETVRLLAPPRSSEPSSEE